MNCNVETCLHKARFVYTASVSKRQVYACAYHIAPFRYYVQFGATVDKIEEPAKKVSRCGRNTSIIVSDTPAKPLPGNR